jgi:hypothetical protein
MTKSHASYAVFALLSAMLLDATTEVLVNGWRSTFDFAVGSPVELAGGNVSTPHVRAGTHF